jgi:hypothetical protein
MMLSGIVTSVTPSIRRAGIRSVVLDRLGN